MPLSTIEPDFEHDSRTYSNCLLVHRLVVMGIGEELLNRVTELSASVLSHTCEVEDELREKSKSKVSIRKQKDCYLISYQVTLLHLAAQYSSSSIVKVIVEAGADVNCHDDDGDTPLHYAAEHNDISVVKMLVDSGADVKATDKNKHTPLLIAAKHSASASVIALLIEIGANIGARDDHERTPLHLAAEHNPSMMATLIAHKANVHLVDKDGWHPLHWAAFKNHVEAINALLKGGANVNQLDKYYQASPLWSAARHNHCEAVTALLDAGADPHPGESPLDDDDVKDELQQFP